MTAFIGELDITEFSVREKLQEGGWGQVYAGVHVRSGEEVAMKFFGYTKQKPNAIEIRKEIGLMKGLAGVEGVVQLIGTFDDSPRGYLPDKNCAYREAYPVIVMEKLNGGDLFHRISNRTSVTESYLAYSFKTFIKALHSVHQRGFIHRDLKLDNVMNVSTDEASEMKLIDFGFMVSLPPSGVLTQPGKLFGTEGWYAPESILHFEYSTKTDIWQAGCILYTMLAGHPPFHSNAKYRYQITRLSYSAMQGPAWDGISDEAKDLVDRMLNKDPQARISIEEILQHPWLSGIASTQNFGEEYVQRIRDLALRQKLKKVFTAHQVEDEHRYLRSSFQEVLPFLRPATESDTSITDDFISCSEFSARIMQLKEILVSAIYEQSQPQNDLDHEGRQVGNSKRRRLQHHGQIDFEVFCNLVCQAGLAVLAKPEVFQVFDTNGDGSVDMKEFLVTLLALMPSTSGEDELEAAAIYFKVFDVDGNGFIGQNELELVVNCLLHDGAGPLLVNTDCDVNTPNIAEMFRAIDTNQDGQIDFEEFRAFYNTVLLTSTTSYEDISRDSFSAQETGGFCPVANAFTVGGTFSFF